MIVADQFDCNPLVMLKYCLIKEMVFHFLPSEICVSTFSYDLFFSLCIFNILI